MNWEAFGAMGEMVSGIAVVASLVFVGLEIRKNTRATNASANHSVVQIANDFNRLITNPGMAELFLEGSSKYPDLEPATRLKFEHLMFSHFNMISVAFFHDRDVTFDNSEDLRMIIRFRFRQDGIQRWWAVHKGGFKSDVVQFVESVKNEMAEAPLEPS